MSRWPSAKARKVLAAPLNIGWSIKRTSGSHKVLEREGFPDFVFAFHAREEHSTPAKKLGRECLRAYRNTLGLSRMISEA